MLTVTAVIQRFSHLVQDQEHVRWTEPELLQWLSDGQIAVVMARPSAYARTVVHKLVSGSRQVLHDGAITLLDVVRNVAADGQTPGRAIRLVDRRVLDEQLPDWHAVPQSARIVHATHYAGDPKTFFVYPPAIAGSCIELTFSDTPPDVTQSTDKLSLDRLYLAPLVDYLLYRAYAKDAAHAANAELALAYLKSFSSQLDQLNQVENATMVNNKMRNHAAH